MKKRGRRDISEIGGTEEPPASRRQKLKPAAPTRKRARWSQKGNKPINSKPTEGARGSPSTPKDNESRENDPQDMSAWPLIGDNVTDAMLDFFHTGRMLKQINATLLVLIPEVHNPNIVAVFRPIAYCNVLNKIIARILVTRMQRVMGALVHNSQNVFVPGRNIAVDLRKAYDMVAWDFLLAALELFHFPPKFIEWIKECVTLTAYSINLKGSVHGFFKEDRGLRQGDPLSPYLFVLVMEVFHTIFKARVAQDDVFRFHWKCSHIQILMLYFTDDLLLFCEVEAGSVTVIHHVLERFALLSCLQVNPQKS
ncbi:UNVERIFIED_CONTAM: LINE-1 reverse transcriptase [Sesamum latifolium]|uniref:LINE-1 reverse transcriptase n=1 Tax=Sesamum latifolium TaxID=2727402 RepID=A0AAW2TP39_9LAMI